MQGLAYDYSVQEDWLGALRSALRVMKVSGHATIIAPSMLLLTKTIKIPHVEAARQREVISVEAEKNIPYPINEVSWDYQVIADDGVETEIFLSSMKTSVADELCSMLSSIGIIPDSIASGSVLEYNTWKYCGLQPDVIILNIGARFTNMLVAREDGVFVRGIPIGGNALTQGIADSLGHSFENSEELKLRFFSNPENNAQANGAEHFTQPAETVIKRIGDELKRSILNYRRMGRVNAPSKIYLTGMASMLTGLADHLAETLKMDIEYLDAISDISVSSGVNQPLLANCTLQMSEVIGEAARLVLPDSMSVNLLPERIVEEVKFAKKRPMLLLGAALLAASVVPPFLLLNKTIEDNSAFVKKFTASTKPLTSRTAKFNDAKKEAELINSKIKGLEGLATSKSNWISLFIDIEKNLMKQKDVWLESLQVERDVGKYNLHLSGWLLKRDPNKKTSLYLENFFKSFKNSPFIVTYDESTVKYQDDAKPGFTKFEFKLIVNPDKPL